MEERIVQFISAMRGAGVRISLAESEDAFRAVEVMGSKDREAFRLSLRAALIKKATDLPVFEELFPIFFGSSQAPPMMNASEDLSPGEGQMLAEALRQFNQHLRKILEKLARGEKLSREELERLARMVGLTQLEDMRYRNWMVKRMMKALRFSEVREALQELTKTLGEMGMNRERVEQLMRQMAANQESLEAQIDQYVGQSLAERMSEGRRGRSIDELLNLPFHALSDRDMQQLRKEVQRLASMLRTRVALRQKRAKSGQLDAKATIRANLKHGNVPMQLKHRQRSLKPKLVVICDVSTSMRYCSELMLSLLYHMQDQIKKTQAFAFIDHLEYISPDFTGQDANDAVAQVLRRMPSGYYNTDLGASLGDFDSDYLDTVDGRTTLILVGDGRNNFNNPGLGIFKDLARRSRRTIWINPETPALWGGGDSDMPQYAPYCDTILQASNLAQLTAAVDSLLTN